jgi:DNA-binding transcriptional ArsR family regulator
MEQATLAGTNGSAPASARERIAHDLEGEITQLREREEELRSELTTVSAEIKSFEQALMRLRGEPLIKQPTRGPGRPPGRGQRSDGRPAGVSDEVVDTIRQAIMRFCADHDEFRQVDIRSMPDSPTDSSSKLATAFERLRQDGVIRLARKDGNSKFYRLTSESMRGLNA